LECLPGFTYSDVTGSCYLLRTGTDVYTRNHGEAYQHCQSHGSSLHLVAIETQEEQDYIRDVIMPPHSKYLV
jgi:hypothetical protein